MTNRSAALVLIAAIALGAAGDGLLRAGPWGVNLFVWVTALVSVAVVVFQRRRGGTPVKLALLFTPPLCFAFAVAWRDAPVLTAWNVLAVALALTLPVTSLLGIDLRFGRVLDYVAGLVTTGFNAAFGGILFAAEDVEWRAVPHHGRVRRAAAVAVGVVLAVPVALVFGALLMAADPGFERLIRSIFDWDFETIISHALLTALLTWLVIGYLRSILRSARSPLPWEPLTKPSLGIVELGIPLGMLMLLFVAFLVLQAEYLFGGEELIRRTTGLTYAEHARRGFFELVVVSALALPLLLAADWALDRRDPTTVRRFRLLAAVLVVLLGLVVLSAVHRMALYLDAYGLTQARVYASAVLVWATVSIGWFAATVLRDQSQRFAFGSVVTGFAVLAVLNVANPDAMVVRVNVARGEAGRELDSAYLTDLSADGAAALVAALPALPQEARCAVAETLERRWLDDVGGDWRSWNVARWQARRAVRRDRPAWPSCPPKAGEP
jgi:hypothetical protein